QGKGLVTRTMRALMRHFFEGRGLGRVSVGLDPRNERSLNVVKRLELEPEAILRRVHVDVDGASSDLAMFGLLREDWEARQAAPSRAALPVPRFCLEVDADEDLYLGLFERDDAESLAALVAANAEQLRPWLPWVDDRGPEAQLAFITGRALPAIAGSAGFEAGIWSRGRLIGAAGVHSVDERSRSAMIGYWLAEPEQGKGIVTRVVRAIAERCFSERLFADGPFERLEIAADALNLRSRAVAERLGFTFEGVLRRQPFGAKGYVDLAIYGVLRSEWEALGADVTTSPLGPVSESSATIAAVRGKGTTMDSDHQTDRQRGGDVPFGERRVSERRVDERRADERRPTGERPDDERPAGERKRRDDESRPGSDAALDEALDESYPASDPPSHEAPHTEQRRHDLEQREEREENLDDALDDTFPASDPVSQNMPHRGKADDE
ncbi:MAG TPA: GNAT family N-acetyltransferase, partial [Trueperaceae bacterium]|nr:GNAT family N-acetyltransferase [Trueperaceae bacterium]